MTTKEELIRQLLQDPEKLLEKRPFIRGAEMNPSAFNSTRINPSERKRAELPKIKYKTVSQENFFCELDPNCHDVLFDDNIPSICCKVKNGGMREIKFHKMAIPFQRIIKDKQVLHLTGYKMNFTLLDKNPSEKTEKDFITFKQYWDLRNQDGMKNRMVDVQKSYGDAGLLYYFDYNGEIKSRILSFEDGYVLCPHNDQNGDRILETVYYCDNGTEYIDSYDDRYMYRWKSGFDVERGEEFGWTMEEPVEHGFNEIPLITKRGNVAWNNVQNIIESYETLFNVFQTIQKRHGWGILYVKGKFSDKAEKLAGNVILNDTSLDGSGDAKFLTAPSPDGMLETLKSLEEAIQKGAGATFILPKDINMSGDISGIAIMLTMSRDIETAMQGVIEWQNVADKMARLFKYGLSKELVSKRIDETAITDFESMNISAKFKVWKPMNEYEYNQMLTIMTGAGILSKESGIELNTESKPDEKQRMRKQTDAEEKNEEKKEKAASETIFEEYANTKNE